MKALLDIVILLGFPGALITVVMLKFVLPARNHRKTIERLERENAELDALQERISKPDASNRKG